MSSKQQDMVAAAAVSTIATGIFFWVASDLAWWGYVVFWALMYIFGLRGFVKDRIRDRQAYGDR